MPSPLSTIGFNTPETAKQFVELALHAARHGQVIDRQRPDYLCWLPGAGAEIWVKREKSGELVACNPHFNGSSSLKVGITRPPIEDREAPSNGSLYCWSDATEEKPDTGFPIVIDVPDFDRVRRRIALPAVLTVQIAAFAHKLECYAGDEEFLTLQSSSMKFAPESYMPSGTFTPQVGDREPPEAEAIFAGHILRAELRTNSYTGRQFYYLSVKTLPGVLDVVADPDAVEGQPVAGGVAFGTFWLSGRVISGLLPAKDRGLLSGLFHRKQ